MSGKGATAAGGGSKGGPYESEHGKGKPSKAEPPKAGKLTRPASKLLDDKRQQAKALRETGQALAKKGELIKALAAYDQAIAVWPRYYGALHARALLLLRLKRIEQSRKALYDLIGTHPDREAAYKSLMNLLITESRLPEAAQVLARFQSALPDSPLRAEVESRYAEAEAAHRESGRPVGNYGPWLRIRQLNVTLNRHFRETPGAALNNVIRAAASIDCFETAIAVAEYALVMLPTLRGTDRDLAAGAVVEAFIAAGRREEAWNILKVHPGAANTSDALFSFFAAEVSEGGFDVALAQGRTGQLNGYYISRHAEAAGAFPLVAAARTPEAFKANPQNFLLTANYFLGRDHRAYLQMINRFLQPYDVGLLDEDAALAEGIVLASLRFKPQPPVVAADMPLVSVLMAAHNAAATVGYSIDSIVAQTYGRFELLICDDESTDETRAILARYAAADSRIRVFGSERKQGEIQRGKVTRRLG